MTIERNQVFVSYRGTGVVAGFAVPFAVFRREHLRVEVVARDGAPQSFAMDTDYTAAFVRDISGTILSVSVNLKKPLPDG